MSQPARSRILRYGCAVVSVALMTGVLSRAYGQDARVVQDGPAALQVADEFSPEMVLLDIGMPGMDGYEAARQSRLRPEFERTLLVALLAGASSPTANGHREAGSDHHLVKPVDPDALLELLTEPKPSSV